MFKKNKAHPPRVLLSDQRGQFCGVVFREQPSRPNIPVNMLVGWEAIKAGFGWSDEDLYEAFQYNLQVRYALGYDRLGEGDFELRTVYNFRRRLSEHNLKEGVNLLEQAFENITDQQIVELKVRTGVQRMDEHGFFKGKSVQIREIRVIRVLNHGKSQRAPKSIVKGYR